MSRLQVKASPVQNFSQLCMRTPGWLSQVVRCVPGAESTSSILLHNGLYARLIFASSRSAEVTTPKTKPQRIFDLSMQPPRKKDKGELGELVVEPVQVQVQKESGSKAAALRKNYG